MSSSGEATPVSTPASGVAAAAAWGLGFCPHHGLTSKATDPFQQQLARLLQSRLRLATLILLAGFGAYLLQNLLNPAAIEARKPGLIGPHIAITIFIGACAAWLSVPGRARRFRQLRVMELVVFGVPALFFAYMQHHYTCAAFVAGDVLSASLHLEVSTIPWILLLTMYGVFIPNSWVRATVIVLMMAAAPLIMAGAVGMRHQAMWDALWGTGLFDSGLHLGIASLIAIYGSHRFGALQREAYDAQQLGMYTLREKLGSGGMGEVYHAEHHLLKRPCAIKLIRPERADDSHTIARFESEVQATAKLSHPNTIEIYDYGYSDDGTFYYVMEYLPGMSLQQLVESTGPMEPARVIFLLRQVCSALQEAHTSGLIHRDLKPGNIFAAERGGLYDVAKLLDFGLVKSTDAGGDVTLSRDGMVLGSPQYAAPESTIGDGPIDARADIYSLGATAFYMLTGRPVFDGDRALKVVFAHVNQDPDRPSSLLDGIPDDLEAIVMKCLSKRPESRFASAVELEEALEACEDASGWSQQHAARWWREESPCCQPAAETVDVLGPTMVVDADATAQTSHVAAK
ncbi:Serine/threonine-protein kinase PknB [Maioricimonas rarisocia]|uniref:Serine/threonine-protein kinase PknB n=1 Tax=Maioricimonas rarisocia TaxID=2528026 RepID=A0A517Z910_9PLAN|nr:serine/threonine-protein kinase [Maioricimonas rarisocia]QDU38946.1 Serine/threonine-protein kinase PknB [Maioricimonas rarisocia]